MEIGIAIQECIAEAYLNRAARTAYNYSYCLNTFLSFLDTQGLPASAPLGELTMTHFIKFPAWLIQREYARGTVKVYIAGTRYFLDWLVIHGHLKPDYQDTLLYEMAVKNITRKHESRLPRTPARDDAENMREAVRHLQKASPERERDIALVEFLYSSGCRANEAAQLKTGDLDLRERRAVVLGKGSKERAIYFSTSAAEALRSYWTIRKNAGPDSPAFARHDRGAGKGKLKKITTKTIQNIIEEISAAVGIERGKFTPHSFRHAFAIRLLRETGNLALVQDLMGHASSDSTRVYAKIYPDELRDAHRSVFK